MQRSAVWLAFVLIVLAVSVWFIVKAGYDLTAYYRLNTQVPITVEKWEVKELGPNKYAVEATYTYEVEEKEYRGVGMLGALYPNPWAANRAMESLKEEPQAVWINPANPAKGVLRRKFPYKGALSAVVLVGLVVYFICLGLYAGVKDEQHRP